MKAGKSLTQLAMELETIRKTMKDFVVPTERLEMTPEAKLTFANGHAHEFAPSNWAHSQLGQYAGIPKNYYDRLLSESPGLLATNVNHCMSVNSEKNRRDGKPESRMVRTANGQVRAVLSSSYRRLDSFDMMNELLPVLGDNKMEVVSAEITDRRFYIKALTPNLKRDVKVGDTVQHGLVISNSDVGAGSVRVEPLLFRLVCQNGMISNTAIKRFHVGRNQAENDAQELLSDSTRDLNDAAFWATVRDVTLSSLRPELFEKKVDRLRAALDEKILNFDIPEVVELSMRSVGVTGEKTMQSMIAYLANGADGAGLNRWGLANAFTFAAQEDHLNYDQSIDMERAGSQILELAPREWTRIAGRTA